MEVSTEPGLIDHVPQVDDDDFDYELDDGHNDHKDDFDFEINGADADADPSAETDATTAQADVPYDAVEAYDDGANEEDVKSSEMVSAEGLDGEISYSNDGEDAPVPGTGLATQPQNDWQQDGHDVTDGHTDNEIDYEDGDDYPAESHEGQPKDSEAGGEVAPEIGAFEDITATEHASLDDTSHLDDGSLVGADAAQVEYADGAGLVEAEAGGEQYHNASNDADPDAGWDQEPDYSGAADASEGAEAVALDDANAEGHDSNGLGASSIQAYDATENVPQNEDGGATAVSWEEGGEAETQESQDLSAQPDVKVIYRDEEYSLLAESSEDDPNSYFLADAAALDAPLTKFLAGVRQVIAEELSQADELVMRVDGLGLEFGETTTTDFLDLTTFRQLLELHNKLVRADDPTASHTLYVFLVTRRSCLQRFAELVNGVNEGKGLTEIGAFFDNAQPIDLSPDESGEDDASLDASPEEGQYDDMDVQEHYDDLDTADAMEQEHGGESAFTQPETSEEATTDAAHVEMPGDAEGDDQPDPSDVMESAADLQTDSAMQYALAEVTETGAQSPLGATQVLEPTLEVLQVDEHGEGAAGAEEELLDYDTNEELDDPTGKPGQSSDGSDPSLCLGPDPCLCGTCFTEYLSTCETPTISRQQSTGPSGAGGALQVRLSWRSSLGSDFNSSPLQASSANTSPCEDHVQQALAESTVLALEKDVHGDVHGDDHGDDLEKSADAHGDDEGYLDLHDYTEVNEDSASLSEVAQISTELGPHPSTPAPASENTSATATIDGVEIDYEDDAVLIHGDMSTSGDAEPFADGPDDGHGESNVNEIDWDHEDDDVVQHDDTNLTPSSLSAKRSRQADEGDGSGDENAAKRQRT